MSFFFFGIYSWTVSSQLSWFLGRLRRVDLIISIWGSNVRPSVRTSVHPQKVFPIPMKFGMQVEVDEWCTTVCRMTRSKVKVTRPLKLEILQFSSIFKIYHIFNVSWQMTTDSETMEQYLTFVQSRFLLSVLDFVTWLRTWNRVTLIQFANAFAIAITFTRWWRHSEAIAVTDGCIFDTRQLGPSTRMSKNAPEFTGRQLGPWTPAVNLGSGNRALDVSSGEWVVFTVTLDT